jgi:undecaprenyl-diphosphatase
MTTLGLVGLATFLVVGYLAPRVEVNPGRLNTDSYPDVGSTLIAAAVACGVDLLLLAAWFLHDRALATGAYDAADPRGLVSAPLRPFRWLLVLTSAASVVAMTLWLRTTPGRDGFDDEVGRRIVYRLAALRPVLGPLGRLGEPVGVIALSALLAAGCLALRRTRAAVLAAVGSPLADVLVEYVLRPRLGRVHGDLHTYPSGHAAGAVGTALTIILFLLPGGALTALPRWARVALAVFAALLATALPLGQVALGYHQPTDMVAGGAVAVVVVLGLAVVLDAVARHRPAPAAPLEAEASRSATP